MKRMMKYLVIILTVFLIIFVSSASIVKNKTYTFTPMQYLTYYIGSPLYLFDHVVEKGSGIFSSSSVLPGRLTFNNLWEELENFGIVSAGSASVNFTYVGGKFIGGGNVYTIFAIPYYEFGFLGMLVFVFLYYFCFCWAYYTISYVDLGKKNLRKIFILGIFEYLIVMSFYVSMSSNLKIQSFVEAFIAWLLLRGLFKLKLKVH